MIPHEDLATQLVRAVFSQKGILSEKRLSEFRLLLEKTPTSLSAAMDAIADLDDDRIEGQVEIRPGKMVSSWAVVSTMTNIVASHITRTLRNAVSQGVDDAHRRHTASAVEMINPLIRLDYRWDIVLSQHRESILDAVSAFGDSLSADERKYYPLFDVDSVATWVAE